MEDRDKELLRNLMDEERALERSYWLRWRKEERFLVQTKKRSRKGTWVDAKTTSMRPPKPPVEERDEHPNNVYKEVVWWRMSSVALIEYLEWGPVDLVGTTTPRGVELLMTSGTVESRLHQVLG